MSCGLTVWAPLDGLEGDPDGGGKGYPCSRPRGHRGRHLLAREPDNYGPDYNRARVYTDPEYRLVVAATDDLPDLEVRRATDPIDRANTMLSSPPTALMRRCLLTAHKSDDLSDDEDQMIVSRAALGSLHGLERRGLVTNVRGDFYAWKADLTVAGELWLMAYRRADRAEREGEL